jgi:hypothetical protein
MKTLVVLRRPLTLLVLPLLLAFAAPSAAAQEFTIGFGKHGHHGSIGVSAGIFLGAPVCAPIHCAPKPIWIPGHYQIVERQVFVPGCTRKVFVPATYENRVWRDYCGQIQVVRVQTCPATWRIVQDPGRWQCVAERIWIEGSWTKVAS